ncbi:MAG: type II secretion system protein N [Burkholderiales bacterium]|nr:type II secretion system protein N [Burkholderiales bacterium]
MQESSAKIGRWWWLAVVAFAIGMVVLAPAALLERLPPANAAVQFVADGGTIWRGRGQLRIATTATAATSATPLVIPLEWRFAPGSLLGLRLGFIVEPGAPALSGTTLIGLRPGDVELRNTALVVDARLLQLAHAVAALFPPAGTIRLQQTADERLRVRPASNADHAWQVDGAMGLNAEQLALGGIVNTPLGNHDIKLSGDGALIKISVLRSSGPLKLEGNGSVMLAMPRRFTFSGFATVATDAPPGLRQLGPVMADGRQRIELNTAW